jgi:hypothetical protein
MLRTNGLVAMTLLGIVACLSVSACSAETSDDKTPANATGPIAHDGARQVLAEIYADEAQWNSLRAKIASGDQASLEAGIEFYLSADGGAREMLASSLGEALKSAAVSVLSLAKQNNISLGSVCQGPDVDDDRFNTFERAVEEISERERALAAVSQNEFKVERETCLEDLKQARIGLAKFFEIGAGDAKQ